ncbi:MAG TPA: non-homologous end-joining DNA ligase, partial [Segetibacter sp.]
MLAKDTETPFSSADWIYEIKWDGYRAIAEVQKGQVQLYSRNGNSFISSYPEVVEQLSALKVNAVFDGEIVVLNEEGKPDFQKLQDYGMNRSFPIHYYIFDLLELNGKKLYGLPLIERKKLLEEIIEPNSIIKYSDHIEESGEEFFELIKQKNLEGIMAKRRQSEYFPGKRSADWLKIKHHQSEEVIIAGFTAPRGGRKYFGALVLGTMAEGKLIYAGHTGSGFDEVLLKELYEKLQPLIVEKSPFLERVKTNMPVTWVKPEYICEVKFTEWTSDGKLRHPIFLRLRDDKSVENINTQHQNFTAMETEKAVKTAAATPPKKAAKKTVVKKAVKEVATKVATRKTAAKKQVAKKAAPAKTTPTKATPATEAVVANE